ncbi:MAG: substrate-binding periplasmic protein [Aestuariibacter sp.]
MSNRMRITFKLIVFSVCLLLAAANARETLRYNIYGSGEWVPYVFANADQYSARPGIVAEIIPLILKTANIKGESIKLPPKRTNESLKFGKIVEMDVVSAAWFEQGIPPFGHLSKPFMTITEYVAFAPKNKDRFQQLSDIYQEGLLIGGVRGYYYFDENKFMRVDFPSEKQLVRALIKDRVDAVIIGGPTLRYFASHFQKELLLGPVHATGELSIRVTDKKAYLLPRLNAAIDQVKQSGVIEQIHHKYRYLTD